MVKISRFCYISDFVKIFGQRSKEYMIDKIILSPKILKYNNIKTGKHTVYFLLLFPFIMAWSWQ